MKPSLLLIALTTLVFGSCTSAYKTGQTPDDVYYSPAPAYDEYVSNRNYDDNKYNDEYYDDRYLRMKVHDRTMWSELDDWYYPGYYNYYSYYNPYGYNTYIGGFYGWNQYAFWNYYYNPYCSGYTIVNTKSSVSYNSPRKVNLNTYSPNNTSNHTSIFKPNNSGNTYVPSPKYGNSNSNSGSGAGNFLRNIFNGGSSSGRSPSGSSSSGSSSGSKSSSAPVRKF